MVGVSILPVAIHLNQLYFYLERKRNRIWYTRVFRFWRWKRKGKYLKEPLEGCEELTGFYGNETELENKIKKQVEHFI